MTTVADSHERIPHAFRPDAEDKRKQGDLRDMIEAQCIHCQHTWLGCVIGRCPRCHQVGANEIRRSMIGVPRV